MQKHSANLSVLFYQCLCERLKAFSVNAPGLVYLNVWTLACSHSFTEPRCLLVAAGPQQPKLDVKLGFSTTWKNS